MEADNNYNALVLNYEPAKVQPVPPKKSTPGWLSKPATTALKTA